MDANPLRILVVEDEQSVAQPMQKQLRKCGYVTDAAHDGIEAYRLGETEDYAAVILDLGLPQLDGLSVLRRWRQNGRTMPVIVVTARASWPERVYGIDAGADDYLPKPFAIQELIARLGAVLRRSSRMSKSQTDSVLRIGGFAIDASRRELTRDGEAIALTPLEYRFFNEIAANAGEVVPVSKLLEKVYGSTDSKDVNALEHLVLRLRRKIGSDVIETQRGQGYVLRTGT